MITIERQVGSLIETRMTSPITAEEIDRFRSDREHLMRTGGDRRVVCMDLRRLLVLAPDRAVSVISLLQGSREGLVRNAALVHPGKALVTLQIERILRSAANPARRLFREPTELEAWLGEVLDDAERHRLRVFLEAG